MSYLIERRNSLSLPRKDFIPWSFNKRFTWTIRRFKIKFPRRTSRFSDRITSKSTQVDACGYLSKRPKVVWFKLRQSGKSIGVYVSIQDSDVSDNEQHVKSALDFRVALSTPRGELVSVSCGKKTNSSSSTYNFLCEMRPSLLKMTKKLNFSIDLWYREFDVPPAKPQVTADNAICCIELERLCENPKYSDFTIISCEGNQFPTHRSILAARSTVFETMFSCEMQEAVSGSVKIDDIEESALREFIRFLYCGEVNGIENLVFDLLHAANKYDIPSLKYKCFKTLSMSMDAQNVLDILLIADLYNETVLMELCFECIKCNYRKIKQSDKWKLISKVMMKTIMDILMPSSWNTTIAFENNIFYDKSRRNLKM